MKSESEVVGGCCIWDSCSVAFGMLVGVMVGYKVGLISMCPRGFSRSIILGYTLSKKKLWLSQQTGLCMRLCTKIICSCH